MNNAASAGLLALFVGLGAGSARAEVLVFRASLDGRQGAEATGSAATGTAQVEIDTATQRVSVELDVDGITVDGLWDTLVAAPIGPVHFHRYATPDGGDAVLALPVPYGVAYRPTSNGFQVTMKDYNYVAGAKLLDSDLTFDEFVRAMRSGLVVLNVHTDTFNPGEISGRVSQQQISPAPMAGGGAPAAPSP